MITQALCPVMVQREDQLGEVEDALLGARRGEGEVVVLAGDAGCGKTRLATEARHRAARLGFEVMAGACAEAELSLPYLPFVEAVGNYLNTADLDEVKRTLGPAAEPLAQLFPQFASGPGAAGALGAAGGDPGQSRVRLFEAFVSMFRAAAERGGLFVVVEDLHWADNSTRELLDYVARRLPGSRVVILATYRREEVRARHPLLPVVQGWQRARLAEFVELDPLDRPGVQQMVSAIFDDQEISTELRDYLYELSDGNPYVVEETLKAALDRGDIFRTETGAWDRKALRELRVPENLTDSIRARVDGLGETTAEILRVAAVIGRSFDYPTLVACSGCCEEEVEDAIGVAIEQQLIEEVPDAPALYRFRHTLTREAVYDGVPRPKRARLHLAVAAALRQIPGSAQMDIANHLLAGGRGAEAAPVCLEAGEQALRSHAYREAAEVWQRALPFVTDAEAAARLRCRIGDAYLLLDEHAPAIEYLEEGVTRLEELGRRTEAAGYRLSLGRAWWFRLKPAEALHQYELARAALEPEGPSESLASAYVRLAAMASFDWDYERARELCEKAIETADAAGAPAQRLWAYNFLGSAVIAEGRVDEGLALMDQGWKEAIDRGLYVIAANGIHNAIVARMMQLRAREGLELLARLRSLPPNPYAASSAFLEAELKWFLGDLEEAARIARADLQRAIDVDDALHRLWLEKTLAWILIDTGDLDEATERLPGLDWDLRGQDLDEPLYGHLSLRLARGDAAGAAELAERAMPFLESLMPDPMTVDKLVEAFVAGGNLARAREVAQCALKQAKARHDPWSQLACARVALAEGRFDEALALARPATVALRGAGYRVGEARGHVLTGRILAGSGDVDAAAAEFIEGLRVARDCGAWLRADEAESGLRQVGRDVPSGPQPAPSADGGEVGQKAERLVTVLFADIRGFTAMTAEASPADTAERVASLQRWARHEVEKRHGVVDKFAGDAVMATFNAVGPRLDHATLALQAAMSLIDKAALLDLPLGAGIASGPAVVGRLTTGANVSVLGPATNLASRLQAVAAAGEVLLSDEAYRRVRDWLAEQHLEVEERELSLKGIAVPVRAYALRARVAVGAA